VPAAISTSPATSRQKAISGRSRVTSCRSPAYSADRQFQELLSIVHPSAYDQVRDGLNQLLDELSDNPTLSIATYIRSDQPVTFTNSDIVVPVEKVRVIGGVIRKFRGNLRIGYAIDNGRFWLTRLTEENFDADIH
jgi:conjugal transfer pilus assembly protein TraE